MKKIFYILASAIVALGAVACENDVMDNIATENEGLSFVATIDNSKTDLEGLKTVWSDDDVITINGFGFAHQGEGKFTCTDSEVSTLKGQSNLIAWYNEDGIDSEADTAGAQLKAEGAFDAEGNASGFSFAVQNAFLKFTTTETVTLNGTGLFSTGDGVTIKGTGETQYVAINPANTTLSYSVNGVKCKEVALDFAAKNIYNLGELKAAEVYLVPTADWSQANAWFAARFTEPQTTAANVSTRAGETEAWVKMTDNDYDGVYECSIPGAYNKVTFYRMNPGSDKLDTSNKWNNSKTLDVTAYACCVISGWDNGGAWGEKPAAPTYSVAGDFNGWADNAMVAVSDVEHLYVATNVTMEAYKEFKIKITGSWDTSWGTSISYVQQNKYFTATLNGGNISIEKGGKYDVYFDRANLKIYLMTSGTNYTSATEQTQSGKAPETGNKYYFKPNSNWNQAGAKFSGYFWNASGNKWAELTDEDKDGTYECNLGEWVPTNVIFLRKNPTGFVYNNWTYWDRIGNITVPTGKNFYTMASGVWSQQIESGSGYTGGTWGTK